MKKIIAILIITLMIMTQVAIAAEEKQDEKPKRKAYYTPPKETDKEKKKDSDVTRIKGGETYWVAEKSVTVDGEIQRVGTIYPSTTGNPPTDDAGAWYKIPSDVAKQAKTNKAEWNAKENTFSYTQTSKDTGSLEDFRTVTDVEIKVNPDGSTTKTTTQHTEVCGPGLRACEKNDWEPVAGSHIKIVETTGTKLTLPGVPVEITLPTTVTERYLYTTEVAVTDEDYQEATKDIDGAPEEGYTKEEYEEKFGKRTVYVDRPFAVSKDAKWKDEDGDIHYSDTTTLNLVDSKTGKTGAKYGEINYEEGKITYDEEALKGLSAEEQKLAKDFAEKESVRGVNSGRAGLWDAFSLLGVQRSLGRFVRAYNEYKGIAQLTAILWPAYGDYVAEQKAKISQKICIAAGMSQCAISKICGRIYKIKADNILVGRGPGGKFVSSASLNAERGLPVEVAGLTRQQLVDLVGNYTTIGGRRINLADASFDPKTLGPIKLRFYHVQYSIINNAVKEEAMTYNIVFKDVGENLNSSYGDSIREARWWQDQGSIIEHGAGASDDLYKWSATKYNTVCLTFSPKLPSGSAANSRLVDKLCVPFIEYAGGATSIVPSDVAAGTAPPPGVPVSSEPGATI